MIIRERQKHEIEIDAVVRAECDLCAKKFIHVFEGCDPRSTQFNDCLHVTFHGGYGESKFIDGSCDVQICDECAERIFSAFPKLRGILRGVRPMGSRNEYAVPTEE